MKRWFVAGFILFLTAFVLYVSGRVYKNVKLSQCTEIEILLVYDNASLSKNRYVLKAYESLLEEEGIPYKTVDVVSLFSLRTDSIAKSKPAIIFPDNAAQILPQETRSWAHEYLLKGGSIAVIFDAGTKNPKGAFLDDAVFSGITGINYIQYKKLVKDSYAIGYLKLKDADSLQVPLGKLNNGFFLGSYKYGKLQYPVARNEIKETLSEGSLYADIVTEDGSQYPAVVIKNYGKGKVLYVNLPLGHLKSHSDDLPLRAVLRTFLFKNLKLPHLVNVPYGKGGLVINWHIDWNEDWEWITFMLKNGYLKKGIEYSMHITAGDFVNKPGDGLGFDACGKGKQFVQMLTDYGVIGSHGGWGHNWFADNVDKGIFKKKEILKYIKQNNDCLESITKQKVREYSAPDGVHPQPLATKILEDLGITAYYSTGDTGSSPTRIFIDGMKVSDKVWAFPVMPFQKHASLYEMDKAKMKKTEVKKWLIETADYAVRNRTVRLIYSHPYNIEHYKDTVKFFLDYIERLQNQDKLQVKSMSYFADFNQRFLKTKYVFKIEDKKTGVFLNNPEGLNGITIAVPKNAYRMPQIKDCSVQEDEDYYYLTIKGRENEKVLYLDSF